VKECHEPTPGAIGVEAAGPERPQEPVQEPAAQAAARFRAIHREQRVFRPVDVERLREPDPLARALWEMTGRLKLSAYHAEVRAREGEAGRSALDPRRRISLGGLRLQRKVQLGAGNRAALRLPSRL